MGQANAKQKAEIETIIKEVKDIQGYIKRNSEDLDDVSKQNLHKRLVDYSDSLQNIKNSLNRKKSKELQDAIKFVSRVTEELLRMSIGQNLDLASVETNSFIHVTTKQAKNESKSGSIESLSTNSSKKQNKSRKELASYDKYRIPSLEEIKNKTSSLKAEVENSIKNEDLNQMLVQQKIIEILATDLELLNYEPNSPLQDTKNVLEKDLSLLYRKLDKNKNRFQKTNHNLTKLQKEAKENVADLANICQKVDQIMSHALLQAKEKSLPQLVETKQEIININKEVDKNNSTNEGVIKIRGEIKEKINKLLGYLENEIDSLDIEKINSNIDKTFSQAHLLAKEQKHADLVKLKERVMNNRRSLEKIINKNETISKLKTEVNLKLSKLWQYLEQEINLQKPVSDSSKAVQDIKKAEHILQECREDIEKFDRNTEDSEFNSYRKHLSELESVLSKIRTEDGYTKKRKEDCFKNINDTKNLLEATFADKYQQNVVKQVVNRNTKESYLKDVEEDQKLNDVVLRKRSPSKETLHEIRNIDGFYSYWKELQSNLPATNCSLEELTQIVLLLKDIETQIYAKHTKIEDFLKIKQSNQQSHTHAALNNDESAQFDFDKNKKIIDEIDGNLLKTNVKMYNISQPKNLIIDDDEILQNIEEINKQTKMIERQTAEKVIIPPDSTSESSEKSEMELKTENHTINADGSINKNKNSVQDLQKNLPNTQEKSTQNPKTTHGNQSEDKNRYNHIESITQVQNICRDVEYLKEKAENFTGTKQTPRYADIKSKLDTYRKTLNVLTSYKNESITLSCTRVLENIDEVFEILNKNTEQDFSNQLPPPKKKGTIETMFNDIMDIKSQVDDLSQRIEKFEDADNKIEYNNIKTLLLRHRETLNQMKITSNYEVIAGSKSDVLNQINECIYGLDFKLEENKFKKQYMLGGRNSNTQKVVNDFEEIKKKINRFSGSYKNVLYREIEKGAQKCVEEATNSTNDEEFLEKLKSDVSTHLKILQQKSINEDSYSFSTSESTQTLNNEIASKTADNDVAIRLSRIRQNLKDIKEEIDSPSKQSVESNQEIDHRINLNMQELNSLNIEVDQPFYYDKETLKESFSKLANKFRKNSRVINDNQEARKVNNDNALIKSNSGSTLEQLIKIEENLETLKQKLESFSDERNSARFFDLDECLTELSMQVDKIATKKNTEIHKRKKKISKTIYQYCELLENKAQSYEILQNIDKKLKEVMYRLNNFQDLSAGDFNALYRELTDLDVTLRDLNVSENIQSKKICCQFDIQQTMRTIEDRMNAEDDCDSDDGTCV